jgi:hypothetical protein
MSTTGKKIGLSLSFCVGDIVRGRVALSDVKKIVAGTGATTPEQWDEVIRRYRESYWSSFPDQAEQVARGLIADGKIEQPRLTDHRAPYVPRGTSWVDDESQINWQPSLSPVQA